MDTKKDILDSQSHVTYIVTDDLQASKVKVKQPNVERETWTNDWEFIMSCIALAIGLGNVWRFPFIALDNGGGAFLIPYLVILMLIGKPIYYLELLIGQFCGRGCIKVYDMVPAMRGIGYGQTYAVAMVSTYYGSLIALTIRFLIASFDIVLPWSRCKDEWGPLCFDSGRNSTEGYAPNPNGNTSSSEFYFYKEILKEVDTLDNGIGLPDWKLVLCLAGSWMCVVLILVKGIKSSGKASYFLALSPYVIMVVLLVRAVTLPGSANGILLLITPQWNQLLNPRVWFAAVTQVFYSLSIFLGEIIIYASHNRFRQNVYKVAVTITIVDTITSMTSGIIIFGIVGNLAYEMGTTDIASVVKGGSGLAFVSYPEAIAKFVFWPQVFSAVFFIMLFIIAVGCVVGLQICLMTSIQDQFKIKKQFYLIVGLATGQFLLGLLYVTQGGQYLLNLVDYFCVAFLIYVMAIAELITFCWIYGVKRLCQDIEFMLGIKSGWYWRISWGIVAPLLMMLIFFYDLATMTPIKYNDYVFPDGYYALGWFLSAIGIVQIPIWMAYAIYKQPELTWMGKFRGAFRPTSVWGPADPRLHKEYVQFLSDKKKESKHGVIAKCYDRIFGK